MDDLIILYRQIEGNDSWLLRGLYIFLIWVEVAWLIFWTYKYRKSYRQQINLSWTLHAFFIVSITYLITRTVYFLEQFENEPIVDIVLDSLPIAELFWAIMLLSLIWAHLVIDIQQGTNFSSGSIIDYQSKSCVNAFYLIFIGINFVIYGILIWLYIDSTSDFEYVRVLIVGSNLVAVAVLWISGHRLIREINKRIESSYTKKIKLVIGVCSEALISRMIFDIVAIFYWEKIEAEMHHDLKWFFLKLIFAFWFEILPFLTLLIAINVQGGTGDDYSESPNHLSLMEFLTTSDESELESSRPQTLEVSRPQTIEIDYSKE